jgi:predicted DNA-binding transcriptional regulator YafY
MSDTRPNNPNREKAALQEWLPTVILKFLVFLAFAFILYEAMVGLGEQDLSSSRAWIVVAGMAGLLLLLAVERLTGLKVSPTGVEATLAEAQAHALEEIGALDDPEVSETAREQILQAESADQVQAVMQEAVKLNVSRILGLVKEAIQNKHRCYVRYRPDPTEPVQTYHVAPLDIRPGRTPTTKDRDYLWAYSYEHESTVSLRMDRILGVERSEETFDPAEVMADWKKAPQWNVEREW